MDPELGGLEMEPELYSGIVRQIKQNYVRRHHEAGHTVAAYRLLYIQLKSVSIKPDKTSLGRCLIDRYTLEDINSVLTTPARFEGQWFDDWTPLLRRDYLERWAMVALAGQIAELRYLEEIGCSETGIATADSEDMGWGSDEKIVSDCLHWIAEEYDDLEKHREWLKARAEQLIATSWTFVDAIATELHRREELTRDELDGIYQGLNRPAP
jgi:hypothetical protein